MIVIKNKVFWILESWIIEMLCGLCTGIGEIFV
uniref:Uncharacterized protein n=1 Tax=Rhizophora mucronata TaxID=61149 RepID=A0A2P2QD17_RHIMU